MEFPTHCFDCGVVLMAGATRHKPTCVLVHDNLVVECECRDPACRHPAHFHTGDGGACLVCDRNCWC
jgi:hypothetical protein